VSQWNPSCSSLHCLRIRVLYFHVWAKYDVMHSYESPYCVAESPHTSSNWRTLQRNTKWAHFVFLRSVCQLLVTASVVPSSPILVTLMKDVLSSSKTSVLTRATRCIIQEDAILYDDLTTLLKFWTLMTSRVIFLTSVPRCSCIQYDEGCRWSVHPHCCTGTGRQGCASECR
jgi:hypothetical protein